MGLEVGILGLPNVGKSTLFRAITEAPAEAANYPFCTIEPNVGVVPVPDSRLIRIAELIQPHNVVATTLKMVDIAGLVQGASKGEGLGNQFLGHVRQVDALAHIVRCFEDENIVHVEGKVDPKADIETIQTELILADLEQAEKKLEKTKRTSKGKKGFEAEIALYEKLVLSLGDGKMCRSMEFDESEQIWLRELNLLTAKPYFYVMNVSEEELRTTSPTQKVVEEISKNEQVHCLKISCEIEAELAEMSSEERQEFMKDLGISTSGLDQVIQEGYRLLNQITFFTAGKQEVRAWNVPANSLAPQAAGKIHSDMERGFIRAEVFHYTDLAQYGSENAVKESGKWRVEGKEYTVIDGDIMHFRFHV